MHRSLALRTAPRTSGTEVRRTVALSSAKAKADQCKEALIDLNPIALGLTGGVLCPPGTQKLPRAFFLRSSLNPHWLSVVSIGAKQKPKAHRASWAMSAANELAVFRFSSCELTQNRSLFSDQLQQRFLRIGKLGDPFAHQSRLEMLEVHLLINFG